MSSRGAHRATDGTRACIDIPPASRSVEPAGLSQRVAELLEVPNVRCDFPAALAINGAGRERFQNEFDAKVRKLPAATSDVIHRPSQRGNEGARPKSAVSNRHKWRCSRFTRAAPGRTCGVLGGS